MAATAQSRVDILLAIQSRLDGLTNTIRGMDEADRKARGLGQTLRTGFAIGAGILSIQRITSALRDFTRQAVALGSALVEQREATGLTIRELQIYGNALTSIGGNKQNLTRAFTAQNSAIQEGLRGVGTYTRAFDTLGVSVEELRGLDPSAQFQRIGRAVAEAEDQQAAMNAASQIYGRRIAPEMIAVMRRINQDGWEEMAAQIESTYGTMTAAQAEALERAGEAMERWKNRAVIAVGGVLAEFENVQSIKAFGFFMLAEAARFGGGLADVILNTGTLIPRVIGAAFATVAHHFGDLLRAVILRLRIGALQVVDELFDRAPFLSSPAALQETLAQARAALEDIDVGSVDWASMREDFVRTLEDSTITLGRTWGETAAEHWERRARWAGALAPRNVFTGEQFDPAGAEQRRSGFDFSIRPGGEETDPVDDLVAIDEQAKQVRSTFDGIGLSTQQVAGEIYGLAEGTRTWGTVAAAASRMVITGLINVGLEMIKQSLLRRMLGRQETSEDVSNTMVRLAPKSAEAAASSVGSWGVSAVVGTIAAIAAIAAITAAISGAFNQGGVVPGGVSATDDRLILASAGERVIRNGPSQRYGPMLDAINAGWDPVSALAATIPAAGPRLDPRESGPAPGKAAQVIHPDRPEAGGVDVGLYLDMDTLLDRMESSGRARRMVFDVFQERRMELS